MTGAKPGFRGGVNVAMKIPKSQFEATLRFYRDVLGFEVRQQMGQGTPVSYSLEFGPVTLWLDRVDNYAHADVWLEIATDDLDAATEHLGAHGTRIRDELEPLYGVNGHWISNPAGVVHLLVEQAVEEA
ncbi:MAG TPA: VOC family protein [Steroidobacteraceae bacterium]|nr:VOC family protein [Steroidobacteraceae bacterium]